MTRYAYALTAVVVAVSALFARADVTRHVNTLIGTDYTGNTYPGAQTPFGMVQLSPDNGLPGWDRIAGYFYPDSTIAGFSHTHLSGTGAGDLYDISFMPVTFPVREAPAPLGVHSRFSHDDETATAGYYQVRLTDYDINVELTATDRCGIQRYTFPGGAAAVILDLAKATNWDATLDSRISVADSVTVEGYRFSDGWARGQRLWFRTRFSQPWDSVVVRDTPVIAGGQTTGSGQTAWFYFTPSPGEQITVTTALSCTGPDGARLNLEAEAGADDFEGGREAAREAWEKALSAIAVEGGSQTDLTKFYTALYHSMLAPTVYCDVDGSYRSPDGSVRRAKGWTNYGTFSLWDTYRAQHPLITILDPGRARDFALSLMAFGRENGRLPVWNFQGVETDMMIGYHSVPVIVDACLKGLLSDSEAREALRLCVATATLDSYRQIGDYRRLGYVPCDSGEEWSMSKTLEYAYDDHCISLLAEKLGDKAVTSEFRRRAQNYRNQFNPSTSFMQPRDSQGCFIDGFSPDDYSKHICESNAWHYMWSVQHDVDGLIDLVGGRSRFLEKLDSMMTYNPSADASLPIFSTGMIGQYAQGNEPSHHVIYLHNLAGRPDLTQKYVARVVSELYDDTPAGLCGNDDCGQMSAWFVMSAMGFYPVDPVSGRYELGTPLFRRMSVRLGNGKTFVVEAPGLSKSNIYVKSVKVNGEPWHETYITHDQITGGALVELEMSPVPVTGSSPDYTRYVNPLMGTQSSFELSAGNTYPATARPWGMNFWTPQTGRMGDGWIYTYDAHRLRGIRQTHQPSPWINDYGQFSLMATVGAPVFDENRRASWFSHKSEVSEPHYYGVYLADYDVMAEVTPTERAAMFRFTFPQTDSANVVIDAFDHGSAVTVDRSARRVTGYTTRNSGGVPDNFRNYFVVEFDSPIESYVLVRDSVPVAGATGVEGCHCGAVLTFRTRRGEQVGARVASSFISPGQALLNLSETDGMTFDSLRTAGRREWNAQLGRISVSGGSERDLSTFYSCLYRSLLFPRKFYEIDASGQPLHYSPHTGETLPGYMYTDTGFWDTFRSLFPLLNLCYPDVSLEIQEGLLNHWRESGFVPEWGSPGHRGCMVGNNSASVLADAWLSGVHVADTAALWSAATAGVSAVHPSVTSSGRLGHEYYNTLGYVPYDVRINESVARTLEYAYDDWCLHRLAVALGRPEAEQRLFASRALNYRNVFDPSTSLMRGRNADGSFQSPFSPLKWGDAFTEGNAWHYTWSVFHDPAGLISLMGGREKFVAMLDSVFAVPPLFDDSYYGFPIHEIREMTVMNMGNYAHGNQPAQHMIYLYNYAGQPWKAQERLHEVMRRMYSPTPDGYCGDEDNGQTSAWFVFSAMGFYPVAPGTGEYAIGSPLFDRVVIAQPSGLSAEIRAAGRGVYIGGVTLDGKPYTPTYFRLADLRRGARIAIDRSESSSTGWGTSPADAPYSFTNVR